MRPLISAHRKGLQFYNQLTELSATLARNVKSFVSERRLEREKLAGQAEVQRRLSTAPPANTKPPVPPPPRSPPSIEASFASMNLQSGTSRPSPPAKPPYARPPSYIPPPPPQLPRSAYAAPPLDPYASLGLLGSSQYAQPPAPPPPPSVPQRQSSFSPPHQYASPGYTGFPAPPPPIQYTTPPPPPSTSPRPPTQYQPIPPPPQGYNPQFYQGYGR
jgi:hypothetical protein